MAKREINPRRASFIILVLVGCVTILSFFQVKWDGEEILSMAGDLHTRRSRFIFFFGSVMLVVVFYYMIFPKKK